LHRSRHFDQFARAPHGKCEKSKKVANKIQPATST
jgi:hypothetical protein